MTVLLLALACQGDPVDSGGVGPDDLGEPDVLEMPELTDEELASLAEDALALAVQVSGQQPWLGQQRAFEHAEDGCPDVYAGNLPSYTATAIGGWGWEDTCTTAEAVSFEGYLWWLSQVSVNGELGGSPPGKATARRVLLGDAAVNSGLDALFGFEGTVDESMDIEVGRETFKWAFSSDFDVVATGLEAFTPEDPTPNGWRASGSLTTHGGDLVDLSLALDAWFFGPVLEDRMDAMSASIDWSQGDSGETCTKEPFGSLSVRLTDETWLDMIFLGASEEASSPDCDGCARLFVRGLETGTVCPDLSFLWDGRLQPPTLDTWVFVPRDVGLDP